MGKKRKKNSNWIPPKGSSAYFSVTSDHEFKEKHPIRLFFLSNAWHCCFDAPCGDISYFCTSL